MGSWAKTKKEMPRFAARHFSLDITLSLADSRSPKDIPKNASRSAASVAVSAVAVAAVSITGILPISLVIATKESLTECLR